MYSKLCPTKGCGFVFTAIAKPHKDMAVVCPGCQQETKLADAKELPEQSVAETTKEAK